MLNLLGLWEFAGWTHLIPKLFGFITPNPQTRCNLRLPGDSNTSTLRNPKEPIS
jgi:hypothetical protein